VDFCHGHAGEVCETDCEMFFQRKSKECQKVEEDKDDGSGGDGGNSLLMHSNQENDHMNKNNTNDKEQWLPNQESNNNHHNHNHNHSHNHNHNHQPLHLSQPKRILQTWNYNMVEKMKSQAIPSDWKREWQKPKLLPSQNIKSYKTNPILPPPPPPSSSTLLPRNNNINNINNNHHYHSNNNNNNNKCTTVPINNRNNPSRPKSKKRLTVPMSPALNTLKRAKLKAMNQNKIENTNTNINTNTNTNVNINEFNGRKLNSKNIIKDKYTGKPIIKPKHPTTTLSNVALNTGVITEVKKPKNIKTYR